jgi:Ni/Co efflux regulator RcnB
MKLVLVSAAALTLVGGTAVTAQPSAPRGAWHTPVRDAATSRHWSRGDTLPAADRTANDTVDYRSNHLRRPRAGRRWVKVDNDNFAETSVKTGRIYQIIGPR